jgi:hypothetical protein
MRSQARLIGVIGTTLLFVGVGVAAVQEDGFTVLTKIVSLSGIALVLVAALMALGAIIGALKQGRYGMNVVTGTLLVFGILVLVNVLGARYFLRSDRTAVSKFSLSPQTKQVLAALRDDATIYTFIPRDDPSGLAVPATDLVREYGFGSGRVTIREVDAAKEPAIAERLNITPDVWLAVEVGGRVERLGREEAASEQRLTNAFVRAGTTVRKKVLFLTGHGERSAASTEPLGVASARRQLELENYDVGTFSFAEADSLPDDCAVLVALGPKVALFPYEAKRILEHLERGRSLFLGLDPHFDADTLVDLGVDSLLSVFGIRAGAGMIYDDSQAARQKRVGGFRPVANTYGAHPITGGFGDVYTVYQHVRPIWPTGGRGNETVLVRTGSRTWEEMDPLAEGVVPTAEAGRDNAGPLPLIVAVSNRAAGAPVTVPTDATQRVRAPETRLVVAGDSDFVTNVFIGVQPNRDLFLNAIAWLAEEDDLVAVRAKSPDSRPLEVTPAERNFMRIASIVLFPVAVLATGLIAWARRRRSDV